MELRFVGGVYGGNTKPTPFLCLVLKMLQIQPDKDIVIEFIRQEDSKYIRALGALYMRLTASYVEVYKYLEPLFNDYRKLRWMNKNGTFEIVHMDELIDKLLRDESICDIQLPRLQVRPYFLFFVVYRFLKRMNLTFRRRSHSPSYGKDKDHERDRRRRSKSRERRKSPGSFPALFTMLWWSCNYLQTPIHLIFIAHRRFKIARPAASAFFQMLSVL
ncbi:unnamed protein product [Soboliphyme baturini]|uniref:Pre-mRNA-splicing factor 38 n=1 Tax=Soboliphyme baturini TaxID=241478 RepID=A0A183IE68_9BILA|nr:unnamed protein product [Soboliphyme baturini]